jgi:hypothetical protein
MNSPRLSFKGYKLSEALYRNKDSIKAVVAVLGGVNIVIGLDWKTLLLTFTATLGTLIVKLIVDAIDFYFTEVNL